MTHSIQRMLLVSDGVLSIVQGVFLADFRVHTRPIEPRVERLVDLLELGKYNYHKSITSDYYADKCYLHYS